VCATLIHQGTAILTRPGFALQYKNVIIA
jgi:hypothetical protein